MGDGIVFASESRTNARVDNFASFCKMTVFERSGDRVFVLLSSGNLAAEISFDSSFILCGQILGESPRLFRIDTQSNFIEVSQDSPYLQTSKKRNMENSLLTGLSPARPHESMPQNAFWCPSNLSVGMPIDLLCYQRDSFEVSMRRWFDKGDIYFDKLNKQWTEGLRYVFSLLPNLEW